MRTAGLVAAGSILLAMVGCSSSEPAQAPVPSGLAPVDTPQAPDTAQPSADAPRTGPGAVTAGSLPEATDLRWPGQWHAEETAAGGGDSQLSVCQQSRWESSGASSVFRRTFSAGGQNAAAVAMGFDSGDAAQQGQQALDDWFNGCADALSSQSRTEGRQAATRPVQAGDGQGTVRVWTYRGEQGPAYEISTLVHSGSHLEVLVLQGSGAVPAQLADHPTTATVEAAVARLGH